MTLIAEVLKGTVSKVTYHNAESGWSVLRVNPFDSPETQETVTVHQTQVFAGATMEFRGAWTIDRKYGRQFRATEALEQKPATINALEKYIGSGLIKGVGPKTAKKIVRHFQHDAIEVFEHHIERLKEIEGIAEKKLSVIATAWQEHREIRDVMIFLQGHGISTLFAVKIYKSYGADAIKIVSENPYRLSNDIYGIGFFSADKIALSVGCAIDSQQRIMAAIKHVLAASREQGHCYLTEQQVHDGVTKLLSLDVTTTLPCALNSMRQLDELRTRNLIREGQSTRCYYSKTLYYDEAYVAEAIGALSRPIELDKQRVSFWLKRYCQDQSVQLSDQQAMAVEGIVATQFAVLTGGPGCGKTTTTKVIVKLLYAMKKRVLLAAPTGRATQRLSEVIGKEAKTIHRLLEWKGGEFQKNATSPLDTDYLIVDECSMLDISIAAALLKAIPPTCQVLLIGDPDQIPSVGAGNVLKDIIASAFVPCFHLTKVFRQASASHIIQYAHTINHGMMPRIESPFKKPSVWQESVDCLFIDSDEATQSQLRFIQKAKAFLAWRPEHLEATVLGEATGFEFRADEEIRSAYEMEFEIPKQFKHVDLDKLQQTSSTLEALKHVIKKIHPWSSLHYGASAADVITNLYLEKIPQHQGKNTEIQILSPMTRGTLGTVSLNKQLQQAANPGSPDKRQLTIGERILREGDRVIHRRNNYDLAVFNGDIGHITSIDNQTLTCTVEFMPGHRKVVYQKEDITELDLAYSITIHKSQGSEFEAVIVPVFTQHFNMLYRNLIYTALTRARKLAIFVGTRRALSMAIGRQDTSLRQTALQFLLKGFDRN